ncbi:hypothetical protein F4804DRAFT_216452 [Jackrogersella minutella]|nr:hypothetical protein F4804DRAFT_216452 [Jackrogersella minutella]
MKATNYRYITLLPCLQVLSLVASIQFSNNICPSFSLIQSEFDDTQDPIIEFVATCSIDSSQEYRTSSLNLGQCFTNYNGDLILATSPNAYAPGSFSASCDSCGIALQGPYTISKDKWHVALICNCKKMLPGGMHIPANIRIDDALNVTNGTLECFGYKGVPMEYSTSANPVMLPLPETTTTTSTVIHNDTIMSTVTVTNTSTVISSATATTTALTTVISSCESPTQVTVTKSYKDKITYKETETTTVISSVIKPVTILVSVPVTQTPSATPRVVASLRTIVMASIETP